MIRIKNSFGIARLPNEYQEVEYLELTGTQYINTGYTAPANSNVEVEIKTSTQIDGNGRRFLFGTRGGASFILWFGDYQNKLYYDFHYGTGSGSGSWINDYVNGTIMDIKMNSTGLYINGNTMNSSGAGTSFAGCTYPMYLGAIYTGSIMGYYGGRIYSCTIKNGSTPIRNFIPCYRKSDNIPGFYDMVNNQFYINAGAGTFLVGKDVNKKDVNIKPTYQIRKMNNIIDYSNFSLSEVTFKNDIFTHSTSGVAMVTQVLPTPILGHKYYGRCMQKTPSGYTFGDGRFEYYCADIAGTGLLTFGTMQDTGDEWRTLSSIQELTGEPEEGTWQLRSFSVGGSHEAYRKELMIIDLTAAFGAGSEPVKEWCDENIPFFIGEYIMPSNWESNGETINAPLKNRYIGEKLIYGEFLMNYEYRYIAVGASGNSAYSTDGEIWTAMSGATQTFRGVTYGNGRFVAVHSDGGAYYSTDGLTWTAMTGLNTTCSYYAVAYGNDRFVCVGQSGKSYYSLDGINWIAMTGLDSGTIFYGVTYGKDRFVCVGKSGKSYYSLNGETWTPMGGQLNNNTYNSVAYGNDRFVCVGGDGNSYYSLDGENWIAMSGLDGGEIYNGVAYGNGRFVCVGTMGESYYSLDGKTWTPMGSFGFRPTVTSVAYGNDRFVCVCNSSGNSFYSTDGLTWTAMTGLASATYYGVCCGRKAVPKYSQLKNYTMLYDCSYNDTTLNECKDLTGGWISGTYSTNAKVTKNAGYMHIHSYRATAATSNRIDLTNYKSVLINTYTLGRSGTQYNSQLFPFADSNTFSTAWIQNEVGSRSFNVNYPTAGKYIFNFDIPETAKGLYYVGVNSDDSSNNGYINMYHYAILKPDSWQKLCNFVGLSSDNYTDEATLCADSAAIEEILNNKNAVEYMIKQCTGSFMGAFVASNIAITALNNSPYKTKIYANEHWNKFLAMVA